MVFSEKLDIKLIKLVKSNPVLYNTNDARYMDLNAREVTWQKIGDELKRPAADCKVRWIHIRDVHRRILKKYLNNSGQKQKPYKYESALTFMRHYYKDMSLPQEEFESDDNNDNDDQVEKDGSDEATTDSDVSTKPVKKKQAKKAKPNKKKKKINVKTELNSPQPSSLDNVGEPELDPRDPIDAFLLSIGATLKSFTPYHLNLAKSKIFSVVQEHELQQIVQHERPDAQTCDVKVLSTSSQNHTVYLNNC
ncbi:uncharacterized protein LOC126377788 [Pectinophora gossypiella]|nr:uncharacterized protein LOC126377788 [Pectinophora gossypiella]